MAGNGPSTSRMLFLINISISQICEMGSNFEFLQPIWAVLSQYDEVCRMCVAGNGPSTSRLLFLRNALVSLICEMGSNFGVLQLIWGCSKFIGRGVLYERYVWQLPKAGKINFSILFQ